MQERVTVEITRSKKGAETNDLKWTLDVSAHKKGDWNASWAVAIVQNKNREYFSKTNPDGDGTFIVTEKQDNNDLKLIPAVFYTYIKYKNRNKDLQQGPTLGLGLDSENLTPFFGWNLTYNENIGLTAGGAFYKRSVLLGEYQRENPDVPRILDENIDTLTEDVYKLGVFVAFSYRF